ncbi:MAG: glycerophosphodiester phosphodiesterase [Sporichthyaceae bacterium]
MSSKRAVALAVCAAVVSVSAVVVGGVAHSAPTQPAPMPASWTAYAVEVIAHRGAPSTSIGENTPAALQAAFDQGADAVEFDVVVTEDSRLVVLHDGNLAARTTNCTGLVKERSYDYVRACKTLDGSPVPNLYEMLEKIRDAGKRGYVHVKTPSGKGLAAKYLKAVNKYGLNRGGHVVFYSSSAAALDELRKEGAANVGLTFVNSRANEGWASKYPFLFPWDTPVTVELVRRAQQRGQEVVPTESSRISLEDARYAGVDGFMSNDLADAVQRLK